MSYRSAAERSVTERYILVAAIDTMISVGVWNIYVAESVRNQ